MTESEWSVRAWLNFMTGIGINTPEPLAEVLRASWITGILEPKSMDFSSPWISNDDDQ